MHPSNYKLISINKHQNLIVNFIFLLQSDSGLADPDPGRTGSMTAINSVRSVTKDEASAVNFTCARVRNFLSQARLLYLHVCSRPAERFLGRNTIRVTRFVSTPLPPFHPSLSLARLALNCCHYVVGQRELAVGRSGSFATCTNASRIPECPLRVSRTIDPLNLYFSLLPPCLFVPIFF